ncbi:MAG: amidohydrolase [Firmicutes bacterium]|nr:amidohydrolase [Bacillota bacterium]
MEYIRDKTIKQWVMDIEDDVIKIRRDFHMNPELGMEEYRTSRIVGEILEGLGLEVKRNIANTGVVGLLAGGSGGKTIALRADMDALPIQDEKKVVYASRILGKMHACGHDAHTAILLGTAMVLSRIKDRLKGSVKFIFQPAEETVGGAEPMIREGVLENPKVDAIFGLHMAPDIETGRIGVKYGMANASSDTFRIVVKGRAAHGASPHLGVDAIAVTAQVINCLQLLISREVDPLDSAVLTIGTINGGTQSNIICDRVQMTGTLRSLNPVVRKRIIERVKQLLTGITQNLGGDCLLSLTPGYPPLFNHSEMVELVERAAKGVIGEENVVRISRPSMGVEDFAYFLQKVQGAFWRLGCRNPSKNIEYPGHNPLFDIDEDALAIGVAVHVKTVMEFLT